MRWKELIDRLEEQESGQDVLEYSLVVAAVLVVVVAGSEAIATTITSGVAKVGGMITTIVH
jgi:Flp pilus assembly pilin Flp